MIIMERDNAIQIDARISEGMRKSAYESFSNVIIRRCSARSKLKAKDKKIIRFAINTS